MSRAPVVLALICACGAPSPSTPTTPSTTPSTTTPNGAPSAPVVSIAPAVPADTADLVCSTAPSTDPDGDALTTTVAWRVDGVAWGAGDTVPAAETQQGQVWTCEVTVTDGVDSASASADVTVATWSEDLQLGTCGATGRFGPTQEQCDAAYGPGFVEVEAGFQQWVVPATGTYWVTAAGAQGGSGEPGKVGGWGAIGTSPLRLEAGDVLVVAVGQRGTGLPENTSGSGGGGGGSWVAIGTQVVLVAGGGGGVRAGSGQDGCGGDAGAAGIPGSGALANQSCDPSFEGEGEGGAASAPTLGAGGAGLRSSGGDDTYGDVWIGDGGGWWGEVLTGGDCNPEAGDMAVGGYGGGGCGGFHGGGGGGGYSGGGGGWVAGGAGSLVPGPGGHSTSEANAGDGWVVVRLHP